MLSLYLAVIESHDNDDKFIKLYNMYEKAVFSIAFGFTQNLYDAEEATQSAFFALAKNIEKIKLENKNETKIYVYKAAKSAGFDILRKRKKTPQTISINDFFTLSYDENIEEALTNDEALEKIIKIIKEMPENYRDILTYCLLGGYSVCEAADLLAVPKSTAKSQLRRAKALLKEVLKEVAGNA